MEEASVIGWLAWFYSEVDFGPAHEDVIFLMQKDFENRTGTKVPTGYRLKYLDK